jgi:hypothetical protein
MGTLRIDLPLDLIFVVTCVSLYPNFFLKASYFTGSLKLLCTKAFEVLAMLYQDRRI